MKLHFTSDRHAGAFAFALFGLCVLQTVQMLVNQPVATEAAVVPPVLLEQDANFDQTIRKDLNADRRIRQENTEREYRRQRAEEIRKTKEEARKNARNEEVCVTVARLSAALQCDAHAAAEDIEVAE